MSRVTRQFTERWRLVMGTMCVSCVAITAAFAQTTTAGTPAPTDQTAQSNIQEVIVTGTRIRSVDARSANPISVVTSADISKTKATTVEEVIAKLPAVDFTGGITANSNNGGVGASEASIHNLGPARTLILVNGQRFPATDTQGSTIGVDLNAIPVSMIDHIDVLKDGASAVYGADAIAGVINVVTKKNVTGLEVDSSVGGAGEGGGLTYSNAATLGVNTDRGGIIINLGTDHRDAIKQSDRDWSSNQFIGTDGEGGGPISSKFGVLTGVLNGVNTAFLGGGKTVALTDPASATLIPNAIYFPAFGRSYYNLASQPDLIGSLDRKQLNLSAHYDILPNVTAVLEGFYTDRNSQEKLNPEPLASTITTNIYPGFTIPATNIYNTYGTDITGANFRTFDVGDRIYKDSVQTYRLRAGLEGTIDDTYDWQVGYVYGRSQSSYQVQNSVNFFRLGQITGQFPCGADVAEGCAQANFFNGYQGLGAAAVNYIGYTSTRNSAIEQDYVYGNISGPIYTLPAGDIKGTLGFEQRQESGFDNPDQITVNGDADSNAAPSSGGYRVSSGYGELNIPILKDLPFIKKLTFDVQGRYDYYTNFGRSLVWKAGLNYQITDDIRFRGSDGTGFRAPNVKELYGGQFQNFLTFSGDPCDTAGGAFAGSSTCNASLSKVGINPAAYVSQLDQTANPQVANLSGGNSGLKPETSQQFNLGIVVTPHWIPNLSFSADYYNVLIRNQITSIDPGTLISECFGPQQLTLACNDITRGSSTGDITSVLSTEVNLGYEKTDGIDFELDYATRASDLGLPLTGSFNFVGSANMLLHDDTLNPDDTIKQNAGTFDIATGAGEPRWKALAGVTYSQDAFSFTYQARYFGGVKNVDQTTYTGNPIGAGDYLGNEAAGIFYHDISVSYHYGIIGVTLGIDNVTDKDPPVIFGDVSAANSLSAAGYDFTGRFYYLKASAAF